MTIRLNHTIIRTRDKRESAAFLTEILGLPAATSYGPFLVVQLDNDVSWILPTTTVSPTRSTTRSLLMSRTSTTFSRGSRSASCPTGQTPSGDGRESSIPTTAVAVCTGRIRTGTCSRSSPGRTAVAKALEA